MRGTVLAECVCLNNVGNKMIEKILLDKDWELKEAPLSYKKEMAGHILADMTGWYSGISLPTDVRMTLIKEGVLKDPVLADYAAEGGWVTQRSWWFKKSFDIKELDMPYYRIVLESLDVHGDIFLNGVYLGHQDSAYYPFIREVKKHLVKGQNTLLVRLSGGLEYVSNEDLAEVNLRAENDQGENRGDTRRVFVRKPAYVNGWDWCPSATSVAVGKNVYIEGSDGIVLNAANVETLSIGDTARIRVNTELEFLNPLEAVDADVTVRIMKDGTLQGEKACVDRLICSGINHLVFEFNIEDAALWWPNGMGAQPLYELCVSVKHNDTITEFPASKFGIRKIELDIGRIDEKNRRFAFVINGVRIFAKGANWVPADLIYARVSDEKYEKLVKESAEANFNMLRIWGGGLYERDAFYDACDKYGILVWQDFMFACASYPGHIQSFYDSVCRELDYQTKYLGGRACIALFCGNNEIQCNPHLFGTFGIEISNIAAPEYVHKNCPWVEYWNSSPYPKPSYPFYGDDHFWDYINEDMPIKIEPKHYDTVPDKFVSEYGYVGACVKDTVSDYFDGHPMELYNKIWNHHNNKFEKDIVKAGISKHYTDDELTVDEYLLYAGLVQSMMYEYSLESFRSKVDCGGGLLWMYDDAWGETGFAIMDYYTRRKVSFYGVKRALEHIKLIMREENGIIKVFGTNDTPEQIGMNIRYGYASFDGNFDDSSGIEIQLAPMTRGEIFSFEMKGYDAYSGVYYAKPESGAEPAILRYCDLRELKLCPPDVKIITEYDKGNDRIVEIESRTYSSGVYLDNLSGLHLSDNYFQMLPGEKKRVIIKNGAGVKAELKTIPVKKKGK